MMENKQKKDVMLWIEQFVAETTHLREHTRNDYQRTLTRLTAYLAKSSGDKRQLPSQIKQRTIVRWLREMRARYRLSVVMARTRTTSRFLSFLEKRGYLKENPLARLKKQYPKEGLKGIVLALTGTSPRKSLQALKSLPRFISPLGPSMQKFIALGRAQGKLYRGEEYILCRFDRFLSSHLEPMAQLSESIFKQWFVLFSNYSHAYRYKHFMLIRRFCLYLRRFDLTAYVPDLPLNKPPLFLPYIYSRAEIVSILRTARQLRPSGRSSLRPHAFYFLILLLYATGMRISEALKIRLSDIDWKNEAICIRETKFFKSRSLPFSSSMMKELENYIQLRQLSGASTNPEAPLFQNPCRKRPYGKSTIGVIFRDVLQSLELKPARGRAGPRIHDLRATFAVHRLEDWYRRGVNVQSKLNLLSTYMGHIGIASTQQYLTMTTELLQLASQRFNQYFSSTQTEGE